MKNFISSHKKIIIALLSLAAVLVIGLFVINNMNNGSSGLVQSSEVTTLSKSDFVDSVSENGTAESNAKTNIYTNLNLPIKELKVKEGDKVKQGDIIALLDTDSLEKQADVRAAGINQASSIAGAQISAEKNRLDIARKNLNSGLNAGISSAESNLQNAYDAWQTAEKTYDDMARSLNEGYNEGLNSLDSKNTSIENEIESAKRNRLSLDNEYIKNQTKLEDEKKNYNANKSRLDILKERDIEINRRMGEIQNRMTDLSSNPAIIKAKEELAERQGELANLEATLSQLDMAMRYPDMDKPSNDKDPMGPSSPVVPDTKDIDRLKHEVNSKKLEIDSIKSHIDMLEREDRDRLEVLRNELANLTAESTRSKDEISNLSSDVAKSEGKVEEYKQKLESNNSQYKEVSNAIINTNKSLEDSLESSEKSKKVLQDQLTMQRKNADNLKNQYEAAKKGVDVARKAATDEISTLNQGLKTARANANNSQAKTELNNLYDDIENAKVKAPVSGIISSIKFEEGQVPSNELAEIQSTDSIKIRSKIKEYDVEKIKIGSEAEITLDALEMDKPIVGKVEYISPVPLKAENGQAQNEVYYETLISIPKNNENIKSGMNARVKYILAKQPNAFTVPISSVYEKNNKKFLLVMNKENENFVVKEIPVETTLENDVEYVIKSKDIKDGTMVINNPEKYTAGQVLSLEEIKDDNEKNKAPDGLEVKVESDKKDDNKSTDDKDKKGN